MSTKALATAHPAEVIDISPEALEVANCYLMTQDAQKVSNDLGIPVEMVTQMLGRREVKAYIDHVFFDTGFNNRFRMRSAMDALIQKKFEELDEAGSGSSKDIAELMALSHKMTIELMDREIKLEALRGRNTNIKSQVNVQINEGGAAASGGSNYGNLLERLINNNV